LTWIGSTVGANLSTAIPVSADDNATNRRRSFGSGSELGAGGVAGAPGAAASTEVESDVTAPAAATPSIFRRVRSVTISSGACLRLAD
jgi:hypothetical protein